eukprot:4517937-Prymnesium_polylepis.1
MDGGGAGERAAIEWMEVAPGSARPLNGWRWRWSGSSLVNATSDRRAALPSLSCARARARCPRFRVYTRGLSVSAVARRGGVSLTWTCRSAAARK